jgi:hypothetical protein
MTEYQSFQKKSKIKRKRIDDDHDLTEDDNGSKKEVLYVNS